MPSIQAVWDLARQREDALRGVARSYLPRPLKWAADHPRVLRWLYRLRRSWRPVVVTGTDLGVTVMAVRERSTDRIVITDTFGVKRERAS